MLFTLHVEMWVKDQVQCIILIMIQKRKQRRRVITFSKDIFSNSDPHIAQDKMQ